MAVKAGESGHIARLRAPRLSWVGLTNADRRFCWGF